MLTTKSSPKLYKLDADGNLRVWWVEILEEDGKGFLTTSHGLHGGSIVTTEPQLVMPTNVSRSNERNSIDQAHFEFDSLIRDKLSRGRYTTDPTGVLVAPTPKPTLAKEYKKYQSSVWDSDGIVCQQPKLDGIRCLATRDGLFTRQGKSIVSCPHLLEEVGLVLDALPDGVFLDGELYNHDLKANFQKITSLVRKQNPTKESLEETEKWVEYHMYDVSGENRFWERWASFVMAIDHLNLKHLKVVPCACPTTPSECDENHISYLQQGYEGSIIRWGDEPYEEKRSKYLLKRKEFDSEEFPVVRIEEGKGDWQGAVKRFTLSRDGKSFSAGVRGERTVLTEMWKNQETPDWATVRFFGRSLDGIPRFPVVTDWGMNERMD